MSRACMIGCGGPCRGEAAGRTGWMGRRMRYGCCAGLAAAAASSTARNGPMLIGSRNRFVLYCSRSVQWCPRSRKGRGTMQTGPLRCPSSRCEPGAELLGVVTATGSIAYLETRLQIDEKFCEEAHEGRAPKKRLRFSNKCVEHGCNHWTGDHCGVIDRIIDLIPTTAESSMPKCGIRATCRWFRQRGSTACFTCPGVITEVEAD